MSDFKISPFAAQALATIHAFPEESAPLRHYDVITMGLPFEDEDELPESHVHVKGLEQWLEQWADEPIEARSMHEALHLFFANLEEHNVDVLTILTLLVNLKQGMGIREIKWFLVGQIISLAKRPWKRKRPSMSI